MTQAPIPTKTARAPPTPTRHSPGLPHTPTARRPPPAESTHQCVAGRTPCACLAQFRMRHGMGQARTLRVGARARARASARASARARVA
jgi:hypothetical protein